MNDDRVLSHQEFCRQYGLAGSTVAHWRQVGGGPAFTRLGGRRIGYRQSEIDRWLAAKTFRTLVDEAAESSAR